MGSFADVSGRVDCLTLTTIFNFSLLARHYETPAEENIIQKTL
jgi:hypothetical protein